MKPKSNRKPGKLDNCQTPRYALDPLIPYLKAAKFQRIWEPAAGEGLLVEALLLAGFDVTATDILYDPYIEKDFSFDFFEFETGNEWDCIVTNPPYSVKYEWTQRCFDLGKPWALLMPVEMLGTVKGGDMFSEHGVQMIVMRPRINFKMPNKGWDGRGAQFPVAWYTWGMNLGKALTFKRIVRR